MDWLQFCFHRTPEMCWKIYVKKTHSLFRKRYSKRMLRAMYVHFNCINWQTLGKLSQPSHCGHLCLFWLSDLFFCPSFYFCDYKTLDPKIWKQIFFPNCWNRAQKFEPEGRDIHGVRGRCCFERLCHSIAPYLVLWWSFDTD